MAKVSWFSPAWISVIFTAVMMFTGIVGTWFVLGERQKVQAKEILKHGEEIQANKIECDLKIEEMHRENMKHTKMMQEQNLKQTEVWTKVQTNIEWIKQDLNSRNGN